MKGGRLRQLQKIKIMHAEQKNSLPRVTARPGVVVIKEIELTKGNKHWIKLNDYSVKSILNFLYSINILSVIIEGGSTTHQLFINENLWDEARIIVGEKQITKGTKAAQLKNNFLLNETIVSADKIKEYICLN